MSRVVAMAIYLAIFAAALWFMQFRVGGILGNTAAAKRRSQRNTVLLGGAFGILVLESWVPSSVRSYVGAIGIALVLAAYILLLLLDIRRRRSEYGQQ